MFMLAGAILDMAAVSITSPDGNFLLNVTVNAEGTPVYTLDYKGKPIVKESRLGLKSDQTEFTGGFKIVSTDTVTVDRTWQPGIHNLCNLHPIDCNPHLGSYPLLLNL